MSPWWAPLALQDWLYSIYCLEYNKDDFVTENLNVLEKCYVRHWYHYQYIESTLSSVIIVGSDTSNAIMTSWHENVFRVTGHLCVGFPHEGSLTLNFHISAKSCWKTFAFSVKSCYKDSHIPGDLRRHETQVTSLKACTIPTNSTNKNSNNNNSPLLSLRRMIATMNDL